MTPSLPASARHVRRLRLRAPDREAAGHAALVLEDALRVATLPAAGDERLVLIRRLDLGRIPAGAGSPSLALHIGRRCQDLPLLTAASAETGTCDPPAAVVFADRTEAIRALARRWGRGTPAAEWFWPLAVPGWNPRASPATGWRLLLRAALAETAAALVAAELVRVAVDSGRFGELAGALGPGDAPEIYRACHWSPPPQPRSAGPSVAPEERDQPADRCPAWTRSTSWAALRVRCGSVLEPCPPDLAAWLAALLAVGIHPALAADPELPAAALGSFARRTRAEAGPAPDPPGPRGRPAAGIRPALPSRDEAERHGPFPGPGGSGMEPASGDRTSSLDRDPGATVPTGSGAAPASREHEDPPAPDAAGGIEAREAGDTVATSDRDDGEPVERQPTIAGGLLFVVPILARLGFAAWLAERPALLGEDLGAELLRDLGLRVGVPAEDPLLRALDPRPARGTSEGSEASAASGASRVSGDLDARRAWMAGVRRYCRREVRLDLAALIRRTARVSATRTHLETFFTLAQTDLRIRRAGLDLDPGWVPWLGRVIRFHYEEAGEGEGS